jgi:uncharacterized OB-fold protein
VAEVPIADGLFTWPADRPELLGSRCDQCATLTFPAQPGCPRCGAEAVTVQPLRTSGTIWTWTSQEFRPPSPPYAGPPDDGGFARYYLGYVELEGELRVEARLDGYDTDPPKIGDAVSLRIIPFGTNADGDTTLTYAFAPAAPDEGS